MLEIIVALTHFVGWMFGMDSKAKYGLRTVGLFSRRKKPYKSQWSRGLSAD